MSIGEKIKSLRVKKGYSQQFIADSIGVRQTFISAIEVGTKKPSLKMAQRLADIFEVSVDEILNRSEEKEARKESFTIMLLERLIEDGTINGSDVSPEDMNMIIDAIRVDIKRIQKEKSSN